MLAESNVVEHGKRLFYVDDSFFVVESKKSGAHDNEKFTEYEVKAAGCHIFFSGVLLAVNLQEIAGYL